MDRLTRRIFGLKPSRFALWLAVVRSEGRALGWWPVLKTMALVAAGGLWGGRVDRRTWRRRLLRGCNRCPIYNRVTKACRDQEGLNLGCGCFMPVKAVYKRDACWIRILSPRDHLGFD